MNEAPSIPDSGRNLPSDFYDRFDICVTDDGSKQYSLPHTLGATVLALMSGLKAMLCVGALAAIIAIISPVSDPQSPLTRTWLYIALLFLLLHLVGATFVMLFALITGTRKLTKISIREDGLVWNDHHFFPVRASGDPADRHAADCPRRRPRRRQRQTLHAALQRRRAPLLAPPQLIKDSVTMTDARGRPRQPTHRKSQKCG